MLGIGARTSTGGASAGRAGVDFPIPVSVVLHRFGGWESSLFRDHNAYGADSVGLYTPVETITSRWPTGIRKGAELIMPTMK